MSAQVKPRRRVRPDEPMDYPTPSGEAAEVLRRLLPPVRRDVPRRAS